MNIEDLKISDISKVGRVELGLDIPVILFRLIRLTGLGKLLGESSGAALYSVGKTIGESLELKSAEELLALVKDIKIGVPKVTELSERKIVVQVFECVTCSGLPNMGQKICNFEAGFIAGALSKILGKSTKTTETKCYANGDICCEFETLVF